MSRALGPAAPFIPGPAFGGWFLLGVLWSLAGLTATVWMAAKLTALATGGTVAPLGTAFVADVLHGRTAAAWPGTPTWAVAVLTVVLAVAVAAVTLTTCRAVLRRLPSPADPVAALARNPRLAAFHALPTARTAIRLRPSLSGREPYRIEPGEIGLELGEQLLPRGRSGPVLYSSWEDTEVDLMAPRSGKTTARSIPHVLSAPGAVVATSNKEDLWAATAELRARRGTVWLFDPQSITYQPQRWWWNPLRDLVTVEDAHRLAGHFVLTVEDPAKRDLWGPAAQDLLCALFLAAATSGRTLAHVAGWLDEPAVPTPCELLAEAGFHLLASSLRGAQNGAVETRDGIYQTARTATKALRDEAIMAWVTPGELPGFDPYGFARTGTDTLYLLSQNRSAAAPLIAALADVVMRAAKREAERMGGRLDPPMTVCLDEAANICRIADLPELYSYMGSRGICLVTILQSYEQGITVWGEHGMAALWGAATKKLIGAGVDSPRLARDLATLVGQHDVPVRSLSYGDRHANEQISLRRQDILEPAAIRALEPGTALLLATGVRPALIRLRPWYTGPHAQPVAAALDHATASITEHAARLPPATVTARHPYDSGRRHVLPAREPYVGPTGDELDGHGGREPYGPVGEGRP
ncbi:type IV secretory system conjugative DNA transfer family protein [Sphaerimonospora cavernae]|uniref:Type IV secretory system conjugative DNA transfer family protein n=1 Tax=Sphaerimonospora cavernae TaxID=1740611 RepID=A0ABV6U365_9ACTN